MSLVPTYVYATDGLFYKNPVIEGEGYFICFDDDDPPELVMNIALVGGDRATKEDIMKKATEILTKEGLSYAINSQYIKRSDRCFGRNHVLKAAVAVFFQLLSPISPPKGMTGVKLPKFECTVEGISVSEYMKLKEECYDQKTY